MEETVQKLPFSIDKIMAYYAVELWKRGKGG